MTSRPLALAYTRVSTMEQADEGHSLNAQETQLRAEAEKRGWDVEVIREEGKSGKNMNRPALQDALRRLDKGQAQFLISVRLDRISRSVADFAKLVQRAQKRGYGLVVLSPNLDLSDPAGRFTANVLVSAAEYERELISIRVREGMAQAKLDGAKFGYAVDEDFLPTYRRVMALHENGLSLNGIARMLNEEGTATAKGGAWHASTVRGIVTSETAKTLADVSV